MTIEDVVYLICGGMLLVVFAYKVRHLRPSTGGPRVWAMYGTILFAALTLLLSAPASSRQLYEWTGVANIDTPVVGAFSCAFIASALAMSSYWRHSSAQVGRIVLAYGLVVVVTSVLFAMSTVPENRLTDFGLHYASQGTVFALHVVWLGSVLAGAGLLARRLFVWVGDEAFGDLPWLRRGLLLYACTGLVLAVYALMKILAMAVTWSGVDALKSVDGTLPMTTAVLGSLLLAGALVVPASSSRWASLRQWCAGCRALPVLRTLHRTLRPIDPDLALVDPGRRFDPRHRVRRMLIELNDWRYALVPHFDTAVEETATRLGQEAGLTGERLAATVEAARLKAASNAWLAESGNGSASSRQQRDPEDSGPDHAGLDLELAWWVSVARAFRRSRIVAESVP